jgi:hypothetical protein
MMCILEHSADGATIRFDQRELLLLSEVNHVKPGPMGDPA